MPKIEELIEEFDELIDEAESDEKVSEDNKLSDNKEAQSKVEQSTDNNYDFDKTTVIIGLQILPTTADKARLVLISAGIKGEPPLISSTTLVEIEQVPEIAAILEKIKQTLPQLALQALLREEKQRHQFQNNSRKQVVPPTPELPQRSSATKPPSNQLTLF